jgi:4-hydroxybenzoate polyprenyltransferase
MASLSAKNLLKVSRPEFLPANSASLLIGIGWGLTLPTNLIWGFLIPLLLAFITISLIGAFAAQINTLSDSKLDSKDQTKQDLVVALSQINQQKLKIIMACEIVLSLFPLAILIILEKKPELIIFWLAAVFLAYAYSAQPLRLKSKGPIAVLSLLVVLSILPITFIVYIFTNELTLPFWIFLIGQAFTVYGLIIPAEIRDYFSDKKAGVSTNTVKIGLIKSSVLGMALLVFGGVLAASGLTVYFISSSFPWAGVFLLIMGVAYVHILRKYWKIYSLSKKCNIECDSNPLEGQIVRFASENPKWITLITQTIMLMAIIQIIVKFL